MKRLAVLVALLCAHSPAEGEPVRDAKQRYQIDLNGRWLPQPPAAPLLSAFRTPTGATTSGVFRVDVPNRDAWLRLKRHWAGVEDGLHAERPGLKRLSKRTHRIDRVPTLDLRFRQRTGRGQRRLWVRILFYRRYALGLVVQSDTRRERRIATALVSSFRPAFPTEKAR